jgi:erythromycin esterase
MLFPAPFLAIQNPKPNLRAADQSAFVRWITAAAYPFESETPPEAKMQALATRLAGAQVVGIGEATHGTHEDQAFKAELMKALVRAGKTSVIVLEANRQVGVDLDAFINGKGGDLPTLLRSPSFFRIWRTDEFAGLMLWLRAYNIQSDHPVNVLGIDIQDAGVDADLALRFLAARDAKAATRLAAPLANLLPG